MELLFIVGIIIFAFFIYIAYKIGVFIDKKINYYPSIILKIDISRKQNMSDNDFVDFYIINFGTKEIENHIEEIKTWKKKKIDSFNGNVNRIDKFNKRCEINCYKAFNIIGSRTVTRYKQVNYERYPYKVETISNEIKWDENQILERINFLKEHNFNVTFDNFNRVDQRNALTKELRKIVKERDNYTCQICGKYMPDEVGLHIDHILPVAKGGKSIEQNLRVLCSKCNGKKGMKIEEENNIIIKNKSSEPNRINSEYRSSNEYLDLLKEKFNQAYAFLRLEEMERIANKIYEFEPKNDAEYLSLHYVIMDVANILYSLSDKNEKFDNLCEILCKKDIENYQKLYFLLKEENTSIMTLTRLCIKYERENKIEEAIKLCDIGIKYKFLDSNRKSFVFRKNRLIKKLEKINN